MDQRNQNAKGLVHQILSGNLTAAQSTFRGMLTQKTLAAIDNRKQEMSKKLFREELTDKEMDERERIVKGMKKSKDSFVDKYGDNAEQVMYATATKIAQRETNENE